MGLSAMNCLGSFPVIVYPLSEQYMNHFKTALSRCQKSGSSNRAGKSFEEFSSGYAKYRFC